MSGPSLPPGGLSIKPSQLYGTTGSTQLSGPGKMDKREVTQGSPSSSSGKVESLVVKSEMESPSVEKPLLDRGVQVGGKPSVRTSDGGSSGVTKSSKQVRTELREIQARDPKGISRSEIHKALEDVAKDPVLAKLKNEQKPQGYWDKFKNFFSSGAFVKLLPSALSGPLWSMIQEAKALRNSERMSNISSDAGSGKSHGEEMSLPFELASAMSGHYQLKAEKHGDAATISTVGMMVSPLLGPVLAPLGSAVTSVTSSTTGAIVQQGVSSGVSVGVKQGVQKGITQPGRHEDAGKTENFARGQRIKLGGDDTANQVGSSRAFLKYLAMPPRENLLRSPDPEVRQREESRLLLKRSMGADIPTDYNSEQRTMRDQLEKMQSQGRSTPLFSSDSLPFADMGSGSTSFSTDYLRRMMVSEGMLEHSEASLAVKESR